MLTDPLLPPPLRRKFVVKVNYEDHGRWVMRKALRARWAKKELKRKMNTSSISKAVQGMAVWIKLVITQNALLTLGCNTGSNLGKVVIIANALWSDILSVSLYTLSYFKMCKRKSWNFMFLHTKSKSLGRKMVYFMFLFCFFVFYSFHETAEKSSKQEQKYKKYHADSAYYAHSSALY